VLRPAGTGFLVGVAGYFGASDVQMVRDLTSSVSDLRSAIDGLRPSAQPATNSETRARPDDAVTPRSGMVSSVPRIFG
jgi:hypothetical protein